MILQTQILILKLFNLISALSTTELTTFFYVSIIAVTLLMALQYYFEFFIFFKHFFKYFQIGYLVFIIVIIGFRNVGENGFRDSSMYIGWLNDARNGIFQWKDSGFALLVYLCSFFHNQVLFIVTACVSIGLLYLVSYKIAAKNWFYFFIGYIAFLYFWNHNVFSIRQGLGAIFFTYGLFCKLRRNQLLLLLLAVLFHKSYLLPFAAYFLVILFPNTKFWLIAWFCSIAISKISGSFWEQCLGRIVSYFDSRSIYFLLNNHDESLYSRLGFRWDMILFSCFFIVLGMYFIKNYKLPLLYRNIFNIYLVTNAFFILIIQINHSYRFAYLSWFLCPILLYYPLTNYKTIQKSRYFPVLTFFTIFILIYISNKNLE